MKSLLTPLLLVAQAAYAIATDCASSSAADCAVRVIMDADPLSQQEIDNIAIAQSNDARRRKDRQLRGLNQRRLTNCQEECFFVEWPHCQIWEPECDGVYNRRELNEVNNRRELIEVEILSGDNCEERKANILEALESSVNVDHIPFVVAAQRECFKTIYEITSFNLWSIDSNDVGTLNETNVDNTLTICAEEQPISIEAEADPGITTVDFELTGPDSYEHTQTEEEYPYMLFGNQAGQTNSEILSIGTYTLTATPDGRSDYEQQLQFEVISCSS